MILWRGVIHRSSENQKGVNDVFQFVPLRFRRALNTIDFNCTVGPRLSGHQLSGYLYYPATILKCILSIFN